LPWGSSTTRIGLFRKCHTSLMNILCAFYVCKSIGVTFFNDRTWNYWRTLCWRTYSVGELVGTNFTNGMVILCRKKLFVGKYYDVVVTQINYPSLNKQDSIEKARGRSHKKVLV
jgi:hypothetical protein